MRQAGGPFVAALNVFGSDVGEVPALLALEFVAMLLGVTRPSVIVVIEESPGPRSLLQ